MESSLEAKELQKAATICEHWIRMMVDDATVSYSHLNRIVMRYYFVAIFEWDPLRVSPKLIELSNDRKRFTKIDTFQSGVSLCSLNMLSADTMSIVRWEMTVMERKETESEILEKVYLMMGYIDATYIDDFDCTENCYIGSNEGEGSLWVVESRPPLAMVGGETRLVHEEWNFIIEVGDRFELRFDFASTQCSAYYNGDLLGIVADDLPHDVYLAATTTTHGVSYETTLYEIE